MATARAAEAWDAVALPVHFWIDAEGIVRDGSLGGIGPDIMAAGLQTILPGRRRQALTASRRAPAAIAAAGRGSSAARAGSLVVSDFDGTLAEGSRDPGRRRGSCRWRGVALRRLAGIAADASRTRWPSRS